MILYFSCRKRNSRYRRVNETNLISRDTNVIPLPVPVTRGGFYGIIPAEERKPRKVLWYKTTPFLPLSRGDAARSHQRLRSGWQIPTLSPTHPLRLLLFSRMFCPCATVSIPSSYFSSLPHSQFRRETRASLVDFCHRKQRSSRVL